MTGGSAKLETDMTEAWFGKWRDIIEWGVAHRGKRARYTTPALETPGPVAHARVARGLPSKSGGHYDGRPAVLANSVKPAKRALHRLDDCCCAGKDRLRIRESREARARGRQPRAATTPIARMTPMAASQRGRDA